MAALLAYLPMILFIPCAGFWAWMFYEFVNNSELNDYEGSHDSIWPPQTRQNWLGAFLFLNIFAAVYYYVAVFSKQR